MPLDTYGKIPYLEQNGKWRYHHLPHVTKELTGVTLKEGKIRLNARDYMVAMPAKEKMKKDESENEKEPSETEESDPGEASESDGSTRVPDGENTEPETDADKSYFAPSSAAECLKWCW